MEGAGAFPNTRPCPWAGLQEKLRKIEALYAGAGTPGERDAAEAALERLRARLAKQQASEPPVEVQFSLGDE